MTLYCHYVCEFITNRIFMIFFIHFKNVAECTQSECTVWEYIDCTDYWEHATYGCWLCFFNCSFYQNRIILEVEQCVQNYSSCNSVYCQEDWSSCVLCRGKTSLDYGEKAINSIVFINISLRNFLFLSYSRAH